MLLYVLYVIINETIIDFLLYRNLWVLLLPIFVESTVFLTYSKLEPAV